MSLIFATQLTAVATTVLAIGAIITAVYAIRAYRKQAKEVTDIAGMLQVQSDRLADQRKVNEKQTTVLELQAEELHESLAERKREAEQRKRSQASKIFMSLELETEPSALGRLTVVNTSDQPVYAAEAQWYYATVPIRAVARSYMGTILPGDRRTDAWTPPRGEAYSGIGPYDRDAFLTFRDNAGVTWMRKQSGDLAEVPPGESERIVRSMLELRPMTEEQPGPVEKT
jgi:hypothetical protein